MKSFDVLIEEHFPVSRYQLMSLVVLCLVDLTDGGQLVTTSISLPIIKEEMGLSATQVSLLSSLFYVGTAAGSLASGLSADKLGRIFTLKRALVMQIVCGLSFMFCNGFWSLLLVRFLYGGSYGFSLPMTPIYVIELFPLKNRGKFTVLINFFVSVGKLYGAFLSMFFLDSFGTGNWRGLMAASTLLPIAILIMVSLFLIESPRFLLVQGRHQEFKAALDGILRFNAKGEPYEQIRPDELEAVQAWALEEARTTPHAKGELSQLFKPDMINITTKITSAWFSLSFMFFGQLAVIPFWLGKGGGGLFSMVVALLGEFPIVLLSLFLVENKRFGRKNTMIYFSLGCAAVNLFGPFVNESGLAMMMFASRFFMKGLFGIIYPFTSEVFPTRVRSLGYGFASSMGRVGACLMPFVLFPVFYAWPSMVFVIFAICAGVCLASVLAMPFDTTHRFLDHSEATEELVPVELKSTK